jgi:hypothetical protein
MATRAKKDKVDLRVSSIMSNPLDLEVEALGTVRRRVAALRHNTGGPKISDLFAQDRAMESLDQAVRDYGPLVSGESGKIALLRLHEEPFVEVELDTEVFLIVAVATEDRSTVLMARWEVDRLPNRVLRSGVLAGVDEFVLPRDTLSFETLMRRLASAVGFVPRKPRLRAVGLITPGAADILSDAESDVIAAGAIYDIEVDALPRGDPSDQLFFDQVDEVLQMNRHSILIVMHDFEKWIWKRIHRYRQRPHRVAIQVPARMGSDEAIRHVSAKLDEVSWAAPGVPAIEWGSDALARISSRTGGSFHLTPRAEGHLLDNGYPRVERMIQHLERLADLADALAAGDLDGGRLADQARVEFDLEISLFDSNISASASTFVFQEVKLDNRPHVKVDDYKNPADCGRIYFGFDAGQGWIVVDHVGLHDRY